jgi:site-specific DNA-methyltransferase (adenine-specific)
MSNLTARLLKGNCLDTLKNLPDNSIDSIVTDPPYELGFMGKSWDNSGIAYNVELWRECLRVLKPGGHLLAFGGSRTYHRLAVAIEDAGFEIRDQIMWVYGSGFPKSLDVSKAIDKAHEAKREVVGRREHPTLKNPANVKSRAFHAETLNSDRDAESWDITAPATPEAKQWQGWGTALKPAHEPIVVARKPLVGTVAQNVLTYGTGVLNIDGCRVPGVVDGPGTTPLSDGDRNSMTGNLPRTDYAPNDEGRWPANFIHDGSDEVLALMPYSRSGAPRTVYEGSAARFFYCAKASKSERNAGLEGLPELAGGQATGRVDGSDGLNSPRAGAGRTGGSHNYHPTVKPLALMRYLVRLVTPPSGIVLDPFLGSGTTAVAAILEGFDWVGCELTPEYWPIIEARVVLAQRTISQKAIL